MELSAKTCSKVLSQNSSFTDLRMIKAPKNVKWLLEKANFSESSQENPELVVWMFDRSPKMIFHTKCKFLAFIRTNSKATLFKRAKI